MIWLSIVRLVSQSWYSCLIRYNIPCLIRYNPASQSILDPCLLNCAPVIVKGLIWAHIFLNIILVNSCELIKHCIT